MPQDLFSHQRNREDVNTSNQIKVSNCINILSGFLRVSSNNCNVIPSVYSLQQVRRIDLQVTSKKGQDQEFQISWQGLGHHSCKIQYWGLLTFK